MTLRYCLAMARLRLMYANEQQTPIKKLTHSKLDIEVDSEWMASYINSQKPESLTFGISGDNS